MEMLLLSPILFDLLPIGSILKLHWQHSIEIKEPIDDDSMQAIDHQTQSATVSRLCGDHDRSINSYEDDENFKVTLDE